MNATGVRTPKRFRFSIGTKIFLLVLTVGLSVLFAVIIPLIILQSRNVRDGYDMELRTLAEVSAVNLAPYMDFGFADETAAILGQIRKRPDITGAAAYNAKGETVAAGGQSEHLKQWARTTDPRTAGESHARIIIHPITVAGETRGILVIAGDFEKARSATLHSFQRTSLVIALATVLIAFGLATWLRRFVARPVKHLADVAAQFGENQDYTARATRQTEDEIGTLTDTFNEMLDRITAQEADLSRARADVERQLRAVGDSEALLRSIIESLAEALWIIEPRGTITLANFRTTPVLGHAPATIQSHPALEIVFKENALVRARTLFTSALAGTLTSGEIEGRKADGTSIPLEVHFSPLRNEAGGIVGVLAAFLDITERRHAAQVLAALNHRLMDASRRAGMAEVATNVLHNVGNAFNSVNVAINLACDRIKQSNARRIRAAADLLISKGDDMGRWIAEDPKGRTFPHYLDKLADFMFAEEQMLIIEFERLRKPIEHIKRVIAVQQNFARTTDVLETLQPAQLIEDALQLEGTQLADLRITVQRRYTTELHVAADRHKIIQILLNLIRNAIDSIAEQEIPDGRITFLINESPDKKNILIGVEDNGGGLEPTNLTRIFGHGFTTKKNGHGFGLHASANAAREMGGNLIARSEGLGRGAIFLLELPAANHPQP